MSRVRVKGLQPSPCQGAAALTVSRGCSPHRVKGLQPSPCQGAAALTVSRGCSPHRVKGLQPSPCHGAAALTAVQMWNEVSRAVASHLPDPSPVKAAQMREGEGHAYLVHQNGGGQLSGHGGDRHQREPNLHVTAPHTAVGTRSAGGERKPQRRVKRASTKARQARRPAGDRAGAWVLLHAGELLMDNAPA